MIVPVGVKCPAIESYPIQCVFPFPGETSDGDAETHGEA